MDDRKSHIPREAELLRGAGDTRHKRAMIGDLLRERGMGALPALVELLSNESWTVRDATAQALASLGPSVIPHVLVRVESGLWYCRAGAAQVLGAVGGPECIGPLLGMLLDSNRTVNMAGLEALGQIVRRGGAASVARRMFALSAAQRSSVLEMVQSAPGGLAEKLRQLMADSHLMAVREDADEKWESEESKSRGSQGLEWEVLTGGKDPLQNRPARIPE